MDDRWRCEAEGLTARLRPDGRTEWVEPMRRCADDDDIMEPRWLRCADCGFACRHWECKTCAREERTPLHVCDGSAGSREVDPHRR